MPKIIVRELFNTTLTASAWTTIPNSGGYWYTQAGQVSIPTGGGLVSWIVGGGNYNTLPIQGALYNTNNFEYRGTAGNIYAAKNSKYALNLDWYALLMGDAQNDKVAEFLIDIEMRDGNNSAYARDHFMGFMPFATTTNFGGMGLFIKTNAAAATCEFTLATVFTAQAADTSPVVVPVLGASWIPMTYPTGISKYRLQLIARFKKPTHTLLEIVGKCIEPNGTVHTVAPSFALQPTLFTATIGATTASSWATAPNRIAFFRRPGWNIQATAGIGNIYNVGTSSAPNGTWATPNSFDRMYVYDRGALAITNTAYPVYAYSPTVAYTSAVTSVEKNPTAYTLEVQPAFAQETNDQYQVATFISDSGDYVKYPLQNRRRRRWRFAWTTLSAAEKDTLVALDANVKSRFATWSWTEPETAVAIDVRFISDVTFERTGPQSWSATAEVEEVLS